MTKLLEGKRAVVFGAAGSIGAAVAREFAVEGAELFLAGRSRANVEALAQSIAASGGQAKADVVDALDDAAVNAYFERLTRESGGVDIAFNATGPVAADYGNGTHAVDLTIDQFMLPATTVLKAQFISARAAARQMIKRRAGVVIFLTGSPARAHVEGATAIGAAFGAIETLAESLALELGPHGVRSVCVRTTANVDTRSIIDTIDLAAAQSGAAPADIIKVIAGYNFLKVPALTSDTARVAAFVASDRARMITGTVVNASAGAALD